MNFSMRHMLVFGLMAMLAACAARRPAPVSDARYPASATPTQAEIKPASASPVEAPKPVEAGKLHTIQKGDTLLSVALANGLDYRELAAWNNIVNPNVIKLGEVLRLTAPGSATDVSANNVGTQPQAGAPVSSPLIITPVPTAAASAVANSEDRKSVV